jgi:hypothetical protein
VVNGHVFHKFTIGSQWAGPLGILFNNGNGAQTADFNVTVTAGQKYYFNVLSNQITVIDPSNFQPGEPPAQDGSWGIAGTMNDWNETDPIPMTLSGDSYVAFGVSLTADAEFKFVQDKSWAVNRGGTFVAVNQDFELSQNGPNIAPGLSGTFDIFIKADGSTACILSPQ